ncbi:hypothetical protein FLA105534_04887 [Flavobacterium bizetiae]|uniref:Uncharacterized protein n=1 Tax=Flavobacterium bizetiae TaxID=2704140 RepID=A0A6J4GXU7_9FLAO|nr:hypothetical protein FLA105534_04887 [Flavobacterium bizetiae]CAD5343091.1 hypothetical protein FLA105535_03089 [Flavobacterium bizetiae]
MILKLTKQGSLVVKKETNTDGVIGFRAKKKFILFSINFFFLL